MALCLAGLSARAQATSDNPQWLQDLALQNVGLIDSTAYYNAHPSAPGYRTYVIYYNQPLQHAISDGPRFHMRALITVNENTDPTKAVNHVYCSGYEIMPHMQFQPDSTFVKSQEESYAEIAHRYHANYISIEHRYFNYSAPDRCWENLDPLTAEEAAADFHNLFEGLKKVLKGKWVMSGTSKGGIATLLQHTFYPEDMNAYVSYAAPFFDVVNDTVMHQYWYNHGWNKEYRDLFMNIRKAGLAGLLSQPSTNGIWPIYYFMYFGNNTNQAHVDSLYGSYLNSVANFGFTSHAYSDTAKIRYEIALNDSIIRSYGWKEYNDTVLAYMIATDTFSLATFGNWYDTLSKYTRMNKLPMLRLPQRVNTPFGISEKDWWLRPDKSSCRAYEYQSKCELGFHDYRFDLIAATKEEAAYLNNYWVSKCGHLRDFSCPCFYTRAFSRALYDRVMNATRNATKPIILIYGEDDTWTGAAVKDEYINGTNVQKYILPGQNHLVTFTSNTDPTLCGKICAALDQVLDSPQGVENVPSNEIPGTKIFRNGQILILRGGKTYTVTGQQIQ